MKKEIIRAVVLSLGFIFSLMNLHAQEAFENWAVGLEGGSYGTGITVVTPLTPHLKFRAGLSHLPYTHKISIDHDVSGLFANYPILGNYTFTLSVSDPKFRFTNFKTIVDYYPVQKGIFSLSAGFYTGSNTITAKAKVNIQRFYEEHPNLKETDGAIILKFNDVVIKTGPDGDFEGKMKLGSVFKPYLGLGLGHTFENKRIDFKFDLGFVFQGSYKYESENSLVDYVIDAHSDKFTDKYNIPEWALTRWPLINFTLSYRFN
jgi:hypothetical protein